MMGFVPLSVKAIYAYLQEALDCLTVAHGKTAQCGVRERQVDLSCGVNLT
jgi:hypothetical protein